MSLRGDAFDSFPSDFNVDITRRVIDSRETEPIQGLFASLSSDASIGVDMNDDNIRPVHGRQTVFLVEVEWRVYDHRNYQRIASHRNDRLIVIEDA